MKSSKIVLPVLLIVMLCLAWLSFLSGIQSKNSAYNTCLKNAQKSIEAGLYEQAVEYYNESLQYQLREATYLQIKDVFDLLYAEEHTQFIRNLYLENMELASAAFPENETFWVSQAELCMETANYKKAYSIISQAMNYGAGGDRLDSMYNELLYMVKMDYKMYTGFKTALNGYITVYDGTNWFVLDDSGEQITSNYRFVGLLNDDGRGLYTNKVDTRLLDITEVARARFAFDVEEAGYYNEKCDRMPVKVNGVWKYVDVSGQFLPGEYVIAGSFYGNEAVAKTKAGWVLVNVQGEETSLSRFEDIKLDLYDCHIQNGVILAKENGKYHLYGTDFVQIGTFEADDIDICIDPERIAFQKDGKWGFVNSMGEVVVEPQYIQAKSFANKYAAVRNEDGLWGFINRQYELVIDYQYVDAFYFTQGETCMVSATQGIYQMIHFMFE